MSGSGFMLDGLGKAGNDGFVPSGAQSDVQGGAPNDVQSGAQKGPGPSSSCGQRHTDGILARLGSLQARITRDPNDVLSAQMLRHKVFCQEMRGHAAFENRVGAKGLDPGNAVDCDIYDEICDHLVVEDPSLAEENRMVGTYRFLLNDHLHASKASSGTNQFYSASEYDIAPMLARHNDMTFMELGRSCVLPAYRTKRTIELIWAAIWAYVRHNRVDAMFGCASFAGTDLHHHALPLSFLHHHMRATGEWEVNALPDAASEMAVLPVEQVSMKKALHALPPLIKGYVRLGARFGNHAVIDRSFGTTDVMVILPVDRINPRYVNYYGADATRHAATSK